MYRFSLLFLFFIFLVHFDTRAQNELVLEKVTVENAEIVLVWHYHTVADSVTIYKCTNYCDAPPPFVPHFSPIAKVKMDAANLKWVDPSAEDTIRHDYGIGWTHSDMTLGQNNMVLKTGTPIDLCLNSVLLSWNPYINMTDSLDWYKIFYRKIGDVSLILFDSINGIHFNRIDVNNIVQYQLKYLDNDTDYEFVIQAVSKNDTISSYSNIAEFTTGYVDNTPATVNITCASVIDDRYIEVDVTSDRPFEKLYLLRAKPGREILNKNELSFTVIDSITESNTTNQYTFTDRNVNPKTDLYYYMAIAAYLCQVSDSSNVLTNILLSGSRAERYGDSIHFTHVGLPFIDSTKLYDLYRIVYGHELHLTRLSLENNRYYVNIEEFIDDGVVMKYKIILEGSCYSNTITIDHEPIVEFPNAFYPDGTEIVNKTFYPIIKFASEENYLFIIYNRWGQELYRSKLPPVLGEYYDMQGRWNGKFQGKDCPPGFYAYQIKYTFNAGEGKYSNSGTFMLVR